MPENSLRRLAAHLVVGLEGTALTAGERALFEESPPAGVILFARNVDGAARLRRLAHEVRSVIAASSGLVPLVAADHEGGRISVLAGAIGVPPTQMAAWMPRDEGLLASLASSLSSMMLELGVNTTLSPVADIYSTPEDPVIGTRSFAVDERSVSEAVRIWVEAAGRTGIITCLKHFPGHGSAVEDSHLTLPVLGRDVEGLRKTDILPFEAGIEAGADMVMTGHVKPRGEAGPASLDPRIAGGLLRSELGFAGPVITDALEMAGALGGRIPDSSIPAAGSSGSEDALPSAVVTAALEAGNDLLLMSRPAAVVYAELARTAAGPFGRMLEEGPERLDLSLGRIAGLREKAARASRGPGPIARLVRTEAAIASKSVRVVRDPRGILGRFEGLKLSVGREVEFTAAGRREDLECPAAVMFTRMLLGGIDRIASSADTAGVSGWSGEGEWKPSPIDRAGRYAADGGGILTAGPMTAGRGEGRLSVLALMFRRPVERNLLRRLMEGRDVVLALERSEDADVAPEGCAVIATSGIYNAAAGTIVPMLAGAAPKD